MPVNGKELIEAEIKEMHRKKKKNIQIDEAKLKEYEDLKSEITNDPNHPKLNEFTKILNKDYKFYTTAEKASITGDTVGDPMKDTSGPSLNILIKLSSIISVVFGTLYVNTSFLIK